MLFKIKYSYTQISVFSICLIIFMATLDVINRAYFFIIAAFFVFLLCARGKIAISFDISFLALAALGISYLLFYPGSFGSISSVIKPFIYSLCYIMGYGIIGMVYKDKEPGNAQKTWFILLLAITLGFTLHYAFNYLNSVLNYTKTYNSRNAIDIWTQTTRAATQHSALADFALGTSIALVFSKVSKKWKAVSCISLVLVLGYNLILSGRKLIAMFAICMVMLALYKFTRDKKDRAKMVFFICVAIIAALSAYQMNAFGIKSRIEDSLLYERFFGQYKMGILEDSRIALKIGFIDHMGEFLWGGNNLRRVTGHYAHDIFLDTYDDAGIIALISMTVYLAASGIRYLKCIGNRKLPAVFRNMVLCVYLVIYMEFMLEPVMQGIPLTFAAFCLLDGATKKAIRCLDAN